LSVTGVVGAQTLTEGEIAVIQPKPVLVQQRVELVPRFGATFNDALITQYMAGTSLFYHASENIHIGVTFEWFDFGGELGGPTEVYEELIRTASVIPELAPVTYFASLDVGWVPINGKFTVFNSLIAYYDIYAILGGGVIETVLDPNPAVTIAIGQRVFLGDFLAILLEVRDRAYIEPLPSGDTFTNIFTISAGLSFFIPSEFEYESVEEQVLDWD
jgi:outer membrane beta-barrel protein